MFLQVGEYRFEPDPTIGKRWVNCPMKGADGLEASDVRGATVWTGPCESELGFALL